MEGRCFVAKEEAGSDEHFGNLVSLCESLGWLQGGMKLGLNPSPDLCPAARAPHSGQSLKTRYRPGSLPVLHRESLLRTS